jgi:hypothetical protein
MTVHRIEIPQLEYRGAISELKGCRMGPLQGPQYTWEIQVYDEYDEVRNYANLNLGGANGNSVDVVVVTIERVDFDALPAADRNLQPRATESRDEKWTPEDSTVRPYRDGTISSSGNAANIALATDGTDGRWKIDHQFTEYGVFSISIYVCPATKKASCKGLPDQLIPGTGVIKSNWFTVCPQGSGNSLAPGGDGMVIGSQLSNCKANPRFFSPFGPGIH